MYLILNNQTKQQKVNENNQVQLDIIQKKLTDINANITTIDQTIENNFNELKAQNNATNSRLSELKQQQEQFSRDLSSLTTTVDKHLSETPAKIYNESRTSVVLIRTSLSSGSGFLIDDKNHIVTNWHLIESEVDIEVEYYNRTTSKATVVGLDAYSDLAVIQPARVPSGVKPLPLGDSSRCFIGQSVITIGNPFGVSGSLSTGYVSQVNVNVDVEDIPLVVNEIQLDLTIAPGSSGGALLGLDGKVYGITNAGLLGFNYAVPSNIIKRVTASLIEKGYYQHPYFGFTILELNRDNINYYNIFNVSPNQTGLLVIDITTGYPAERAGLQKSIYTQDVNGKEGNQAKDIILAINGHITNTLEEYSAYVEEFVSPNVDVVFTVWRLGSIIQVTIKPTFRPQT